ncbi:sulfite exporter TauE/SafE family protein, partial [Archaeoglobus sp.]
MGGAFAQGGSVMTPDMFIHIGPFEALFLLALGFFGGMLSGFIGTGGAFVLTPGMMSIGTPGPIAVASNMCHKFPKAMIGAYRRYKLRQLDPKLALLMATSAIFGVQVGIQVQKHIYELLGPTGTNLYVSVAFLIVLPTVAAVLIRDVVKARRMGISDLEPRFAAKLEQKFRIPPMIKFNIVGREQSAWLTIPLGFGTGFLAATIAVGGFIGVPSMIYLIGASSAVASGTELGIAFVMGSTGTFTWIYLLGAVDLRLTTLILATSLIGVQIGAVGTTYVRQYYIKMAMATVMLL